MRLRGLFDKAVDFLEQPFFLTPLSIVAALVGVMFYTPILVVCDACVLLAVHRSRAVASQKRWVQIVTYSMVLAVTTFGLFWIGTLIQDSARNYVQEVASAVISGLKNTQPSPRPDNQPYGQAAGLSVHRPAPVSHARAQNGASRKGPAFAFAEPLPSRVTVLLSNGSSSITEASKATSELEKEKYTNLLDLSGYHPITLYVHNGVFYADATIRDTQGRKVVTIRQNRVEVLPSGWDVNFSANAVEVVDSNRVPVFQMVRRRPGLIQIAGLFVSPSGAVFDVRPTRRLFRYPSWKYPGQYATGKPQTPEVKREAALLPSLTNNQLRTRIGSICQQTEVLSRKWNLGYNANNENAAKARASTKSQKQKKLYESRREASNNRLYHSLGAEFDLKYRQDANLLRRELLRRLENQPAYVLGQQPFLPSLLSAGEPAGPDPFADVCDYLQSLARRLR